MKSYLNELEGGFDGQSNNNYGLQSNQIRTHSNESRGSIEVPRDGRLPYQAVIGVQKTGTRESSRELSHINGNSVPMLINEMSATFDERYQNDSVCNNSNFNEATIQENTKRILKSDPDMADKNSEFGVMSQNIKPDVMAFSSLEKNIQNNQYPMSGMGTKSNSQIDYLASHDLRKSHNNSQNHQSGSKNEYDRQIQI